MKSAKSNIQFLLNSLKNRNKVKNFTGLLIFLISMSFFSIDAQSYVEVWSDEFNTPGLPDSSKWSYETGKIRNEELQYYTKERLENIRIEDTVLIIENIKEDYFDAEYTSASIISKDVGDWKYGKIEVSAKVSEGKGTWPAIWMRPTLNVYGGWPRSGEIDIMEYIGVEPENIYFNCHFKGLDPDSKSSAGSGPKKFTEPYNEFIKFTLIWTPDKLEWYANNVKFHEYAKPDDNSLVWPFDQLFYLNLNLAYGGTWGGYDGVDDTKLPARFMIDYVRIYQLRESEGPFDLAVPEPLGGSISIEPDLDSYPEGTEITLSAEADPGYTFKAWKYNSRANPYTFKINKNTSIEALFVQSYEMLTNNFFIENYAPWTFYIDDEVNTEYDAYIENGEFVIQIYSAPDANWKLGMNYQPLSLEAGNYVLSFDAYADIPEELLINISKNYVDWSAHITKYVDLTENKTRYNVPFTMNETDENVRLYFGVGNFTDRVFIDNVSLKPEHAVNTEMLKTSNQKSIINAYPNPVIENLTLRLPDTREFDDCELQILDISGKCIFIKKIGQNYIHNLSDYSKGMYILKVDTGIKQYYQKFLKN